MATAPSIVHEAVVIATDPAAGTVSVRVADSDADSCAACAAAALCRHKGGETVTVACTDASAFRPGQRVRIGVGGAGHRRSVALMLGLPCLMLVLPLMALLLLGMPEWVALLAGMGACALTYVALYARRRRLADSLSFYIID